jgi:VanZ family protein
MSDNRASTRFHSRWLVASLAALACVLISTHIPQAAMPRFLQHTFLDKIEHVLAYGTIATLFVLSVPPRTSLTVSLAGLLALAGIGILDEVTQPLFNRTADVRDYLSDLVGILLACSILLAKRRFRAHTAVS